MNKYRDKSDFEINKAVAERYLPCDYRYNESDKIVELIGVDLSCEFGSSIDIEKEHVYGKFDPCNNPADAMPIFIDNKMGVIFLGDLVQISDFSGGTVNFGRNFYRTIAELFLMMKDAENES
ncbi:DUF2591 family protein [Morganella morganii]|uniref:DUF2591 family protein n=1 Tax=Morganella morganii TaxID=582 RepID=UPI001BD65366|nr:DUF2591 family protein [Morganella morganii]MBS9583944.1 DUF2591 family protein [Morganella morganii subsp. morganii]QWL86604.1 DUF2591 family protein [Morganella morganii subsp. morganii]